MTRWAVCDCKAAECVGKQESQTRCTYCECWFSLGGLALAVDWALKPTVCLSTEFECIVSPNLQFFFFPILLLWIFLCIDLHLHDNYQLTFSFFLMLDAWRLLDVAQTKLSMRRKWEGRLLSIVKILVTSPSLDLAPSAWNVVFRRPTLRSWLLWLVSSGVCLVKFWLFCPHRRSVERGMHAHLFHRCLPPPPSPVCFYWVYFLSIYLLPNCYSMYFFFCFLP